MPFAAGAKVTEFGLVVGAQQHVLALEVAVNDGTWERVHVHDGHGHVQRDGRLARQLGGALEPPKLVRMLELALLLLTQQLLQVAARHVLEDDRNVGQRVPTHAQKLHDVRMVQFGAELDFREETLERLVVVGFFG